MLVIVMSVSLATLGVVVASVLRRDRHAMYAELARDRLHKLEEVAHSFERDVADIAEDLELAATLLASSESAAERALHAIATVKREYLVLDARRLEPTTRVVAPDTPAGVAEKADSTLRLLLFRAATEPRILHRSAPLATGRDPAAWYRVFAQGSHGGAVAVVVDTAQFLDRLRLLRDKSSVLLVVGTDGNPAPLSDPGLAAATRSSGRFAELLAETRAEERWLVLDGDEAEAIGLPPTAAVATAVALKIDAGPPWQLLLVTSNVVLQTQERTLIRRLAVGAFLALVLLLAAGGYVVFTTRRAAALRERLRQADQLAHLTEKAEKILDHIPSGVLAVSAGLRITARNRWFGQRLEGDVVGRELRDVFALAPREDVESIVALAREAMEAHAARSLHRSQLALFGQDAFFSIHAIPLERGIADVHMLVVFEDLTAMRRIEEQLLRSEKLATAGQLAAGIAHEIGTPLNIVRSRAELALSRLGDHPQAKGQQVIVEQIDRVTRMLQQLLDVARPSHSITQAVDVRRAFDATVELVSAEAKRRQIALRITAPPGLLVVADPDQFQQLLLNLAINAIDACASGGNTELSARASGDHVIIEFTDDGHGIPPELQAQVFDPFFTTKKRGRGTGLGLWVVAQVVRAHAAEIELVSSGDAGTRIRITWPIATTRGPS